MQQDLRDSVRLRFETIAAWSQRFSATRLTAATQQTFFCKLANQDTRIWLTVTPPCKVQQASDATTNYSKHVVLYFMANLQKNSLLGGHGKARRT